MSLNVSIVRWGQTDELSDAIGRVLVELGWKTCSFYFQDPFPADSDVVFTFGPYGRWNPIAKQVGAYPAREKPVLLHWNTENIPDPGIPWPLMVTLALLRSRQEDLYSLQWPWLQKQLARPALASLMNRALRFRYMGDYLSAYRRGWLDLLFDTSEVFAGFYQKHGLPAYYGSWGSISGWYDDLHLERDIDVLWMGKRRTSRRSALIERVRGVVVNRGGKFLAFDGVERPFTYGEERKHFLNRAKITLNILAAASHDNILPFRFALAAANGSLVISEAELPHCPNVKPGVHYIVSSYEDFPDRVLYYLEHEEERRAVVQEALHLIATEFSLKNSLSAMMDRAGQVSQQRAAGNLVFAS